MSRKKGYKSINHSSEQDNKNSIAPKDILLIAWYYFQQHAQQRISYFNFFVAFSALLTTGMISTFQQGYKYHIIGVCLGIMQAFLAMMFLKIDQRNKYLTKHGENIIKVFEDKYFPSPELQLFTQEEIRSKIAQEESKKKYKFICFRILSHGKAFLHMFWFFFIVGIIGSIFSLILYYSSHDIEKKENNKETEKSSVNIIIMHQKKYIDYSNNIQDENKSE